jgi:hypothetical protein
MSDVRSRAEKNGNRTLEKTGKHVFIRERVRFGSLENVRKCVRFTSDLGPAGGARIVGRGVSGWWLVETRRVSEGAEEWIIHLQFSLAHAAGFQFLFRVKNEKSPLAGKRVPAGGLRDHTGRAMAG